MMKNVDLILTNAHVLTMDNDLNQYVVGAVAIQGEKIIAVGSDTEIHREYSSSNLIDCHGKILMPGLVNAHTHVPMTLLRGLADDLRLDVWLLGYMMPVEREFVSPEFVRLGTKIACAEMLRSGITTFADMYYFEDDVAHATAEVGMRALCSESILKFPTPDAHSYEESLAYSREFIKKWKDHPLIVPSVAPHAPYTCTEDILRQSAALAAEFDVPLHTHLAETLVEVENMRQEQGMPVVPYVKKQSLFDAKVLAAHCVHIDEGEMRTLLHAKAGVAHNPSSNLKLASGFAPVKKMIDLGLNVGIGTDGPASNNDLDMFEEVRLASFIAKGSSGDPTAIPAQTALLMATRIGAQALHMGHITGSIEPGKRADIILVDVSPLHNSPQFHRDPNRAYAQLVYAAKSTDVTDVLVNGKWLYRDRKLLTINEEELLHHSQDYARRIDIFLIKREQSVISKLIAIGGATEAESFEVQAKVPIENRNKILAKINDENLTILRKRHYREYDIYFLFDDPSQGRLRYREDHFIDENGEVSQVRSRLTHIGSAAERQFPQKVILSRSRFLAPATQSLRFYKEYFKPEKTLEIEKDRLRFLISFNETEFFINLDEFINPEMGSFLEVKSNTWSLTDAEHKSKLVTQLLEFLGASPEETTWNDYAEMVLDH